MGAKPVASEPKYTQSAFNNRSMYYYLMLVVGTLLFFIFTKNTSRFKGLVLFPLETVTTYFSKVCSFLISKLKHLDLKVSCLWKQITLFSALNKHSNPWTQD